MVVRPRRRGFRSARDFGIWLAQDDPKARGGLRPSRLLTDLLDGEGGYLPLLG